MSIAGITPQPRESRGAWCLLLGSLVLWSGPALAADSADLGVEQTAKLIGELDHETYAIRQSATEELAKAGPQMLPALIEALKTGGLERKVRLVDLIGRIYSSADEASFDQAELALEAASKEKSSSLRSHAQSHLRANSEMRERMAVAAIRRLGGTVNYQSPNRIPGVVDPEEEPGKAQSVAFVVLTKDWKGGDEGLWHLHRLSPPPPPQPRMVYRVKTARVSEEAIQKLRDDGIHVELRGPAYLGIRKGSILADIPGCPVGEVTPGAAAAKAGIQENDLITHFDNRPVKDFEELISQIGEKQPGDIVPITVVRNGEKLELKAELSGW